MELNTLKDLLGAAVQDLYSAEDQIVHALPDMVKNATNPKLKQAFKTHLEQTKVQRDRIEEVAKLLGIKAKGETCQAAKGLIKEASSFIEEDANKEVMDAGLINMAQKVEHYEIASYGTAHRWATELGEKQIAKLLEQTLQEEKDTDELLTKIADSGVNVKAEK